MLSIRSIWSATGIRNLMGLLGLAGTVTGARPIINLTRDLESSGCLKGGVLNEMSDTTLIFLLVAHHPECRGAHGVANIDDLLSSCLPHVLQHCGQVVLAHLVPAKLPESLLTKCLLSISKIIKVLASYFVWVEISVVPAIDVSPEVSQPDIKPRISQEEA